jgi:hypothetical protein
MISAIKKIHLATSNALDDNATAINSAAPTRHRDTCLYNHYINDYINTLQHCIYLMILLLIVA